MVRILVVDDDAVLRGVLAEALQDEGYDVVTAATGAGALALVQDEAARSRPDLIIFDLLMPEMDGWAFAAAYHQSAPPHAPLVLLTAATILADGTVLGRGLPVAAGVLPKPFNLDDLLALVQAAGAPNRRE